MDLRKIETTVEYPKSKDRSDITNERYTDYNPGKNYVCCKGKIQTGPDVKKLIQTIIGLNVVPIIITIFTFQQLREDYDMTITLIFYLVTLFLNDLFLFVTAFMNPGIIKRFPYQLSKLPSEDKTPQQEIEIFRENHVFVYRYCETCKIYRPPRASHCGHCNNCVLRLDHHCPWLGSDVGLRNYRFYFFFLVFTSIEALFSIALCFVNIIQAIINETNEEDSQALNIIKNSWWNYLIIILQLRLTYYIFGLLFLHCKLITKNITTREKIKNIYEDKKNPFDQGFLKNWLTLFSKIPANNFSYSDFLTHNELKSLKNELNLGEYGKPTKISDNFSFTDDYVNDENTDNYNQVNIKELKLVTDQIHDIEMGQWENNQKWQEISEKDIM
ncbi:s-acyltransferase [Anaeramoeba flamelloides]|uniref:Palmitoyltransferase n=1 Tax=Anaeramoeba flamelloides TaxID=1746091 RepID=A0ABQ8Z8Z8_9EUKA|nr:s-acyltransferase [Anaeramoeba flamelloides]